MGRFFRALCDGIARAFMFVLYDGAGTKLTLTQLHVWALLIGAVFSVVITGYAYALELLIDLIWQRGMTRTYDSLFHGVLCTALLVLVSV
jgi:hypothetical protein